MYRPDWGAHFAKLGATGTLVIVDERRTPAAALVFDRERSTRRYAPASTFKIPHTLFALDAGVVADEFQVFAWDGVKRSFPGHNQDQTLRSAMRYSTLWVYQGFARQIGESKARAYLRDANYGNTDPSTSRGDYWVDEKAHTVTLTEGGIGKCEKLMGVGNLYEADQMETLHHIHQGLRAHNLYQRDVHYMVKDGQVIIVDEFTGRLMFGRRYSEGLHQAIEAKEGVEIQRESRTLATISLQNYFRMYNKIGGMTGTAQTEATEFAQIYNLDVVSIPAKFSFKI